VKFTGFRLPIPYFLFIESSIVKYFASFLGVHIHICIVTKYIFTKPASQESYLSDVGLNPSSVFFLKG